MRTLPNLATLSVGGPVAKLPRVDVDGVLDAVEDAVEDAGAAGEPSAMERVFGQRELLELFLPDVLSENYVAPDAKPAALAAAARRWCMWSTENAKECREGGESWKRLSERVFGLKAPVLIEGDAQRNFYALCDRAAEYASGKRHLQDAARDKDVEGFVLCALSSREFFSRMCWASNRLKNDKAFVLRAIAVDRSAIECASIRLQKDRDVALAAVSSGPPGTGLEDAIYFQNDKEVVLVAVKVNGFALKHASKELQQDRDVVLAAVSEHHNALELLDRKNPLRNDVEIVLAAVRQDGTALEYAGKQAQANPEVVLAAVEENGYAMQYAAPALKKDTQFALRAVALDATIAFQYVAARLRDNNTVALAAVAKNGDALQFASDRLRSNRKFMLEAVAKNGDALQFASEDLRNDKDVVLAAVRNHWKALRYASKDLQSNKDVMLAADGALALARGRISRDLANVAVKGV